MTEAVIEEIADAPEPAEVCARFLDLPFPLLLESAARSTPLGRYSFVAADPFLVLRGKNGTTERMRNGIGERAEVDPFSALRATLSEFVIENHPDLPPFQGGAAGYFAYDLCHQLETLPAPAYDDLALPDLCIGVYDWVLAWDHARERAWLISTGIPSPSGPDRWARAASRAAEVRTRLASPAPRPRRSHGAPDTAGISAPPRFPVSGLPGIVSTFSRAAYLEAVERTREYIRAGDIFQANLSQRLEAPAPDDPFALYRCLRKRNPAPFAAYFDVGEAAILSSSPERFLRLRGDRVETRPIKGTAPRGSNPRHDAALGEALRDSPKDRAENVMIVDLLRNDLSIVCRDHSVEVPELCVVESHATVHHLVSTVTGQLRPRLGATDLLRAAFPGGSITGAPKVRAMEIIAELEPTRRGAYTGAIGYIGFNGGMDTNIAIRTFVVQNGRAYFQVGGAIVVDSDPAREYRETLDKARGLVAALEECDDPAD